MKKRNTLVYIFLGVLLALDVALLLFITLMVIIRNHDGSSGEFTKAVIWFFFPIICILLNVGSMIRNRKKRPYVVIFNLLIKMPLFLEFLSFPPLITSAQVEPEQFFFWMISSFLLVICICVVFSGNRRKRTKVADAMAVSIRNELFQFYRMKDTFTDAEKEYRRLNRISDSAFLTDPQKAEIERYAVMPMAYLVKWAAENEKFSESFYRKHNSKPLEDLRNSKVNPADYMLEEMEGCLDITDFSSDVRSFMESYLTPKLDKYNLSTANYQVDYYAFAHNDSGCFYCLDYSENVYNRICTLLPCLYASMPIVSKENGIQTEYRMMNKRGTLNILSEGNVPEDYLDRCKMEVACLSDRLMDSMMKEMRRTFYQKLLQKFGPESENFPWSRDKILATVDFTHMIVFEPKGDEICYVLQGVCSVVSRYGFSITVRNDEVIACGECKNAENPWGGGQKTPDVTFDPDSLSNPAEAMKYLEQGVLWKSEPREIFANSGLESFILPKDARDEKEKCDVLLEGLYLRGLIGQEKYECEKKQGCLIPEKITVIGLKNKRVIFRHVISVRKKILQ